MYDPKKRYGNWAKQSLFAIFDCESWDDCFTTAALVCVCGAVACGFLLAQVAMCAGYRCN